MDVIADSICLIVVSENKIFAEVTTEEIQLVSLVTSIFPRENSWKLFVDSEISKISKKLNAKNSEIFKIRKCYIPGNEDQEDYVLNLVVVVRLPSTNLIEENKSNSKFSKCQWINEKEVLKYYRAKSICSSLILDVFPKSSQQLFQSKRFFPEEIEVCGNFVEMTSDCLIKKNVNLFDATFFASGLEECQMFLYSEFLSLCFPEFLMPPQLFAEFLFRLGVSYSEAMLIFDAADVTGRTFLSFKEFMYILSSMDPQTSHIGPAKDTRSFYMFRYLDKKNAGSIGLEEIKTFIGLVAKSTQLYSSFSAGIDSKAETKALANILNITNNNVITVNEFVAKINNFKGKGISYCLRFPKTVKSLCPRKFPSSLLTKIYSWRASDSTKVPKLKGLFEGVPYRISKYVPTINNCKVQQFKQLQDCCSNFSLNNVVIEEEGVHIDLASGLLQSIRYLAGLNKVKSGNRGYRKEQFKWGHVNCDDFANNLFEACNIAQKIFKNDGRLLELPPPLYVFGDMHGNFGDLLYFERMLWPLNLNYSPCSVLCLGDYVDRGPHSLELCVYLISMKILYPDKFYLLRGNHETRPLINVQDYEFPKECVIKLGETQGNKIYEAINTVFDVLPLAAVIDNKLFCCHGGIPPPWIAPSIYAVKSIPSPLPYPESNNLAWELMWNDPIRNTQNTNAIRIEMNANEGFCDNKKRGTAHLFNSTALEKFLRQHNFSHVIRAHELSMAGFTLWFGGKLISMFSTSKYGNFNNVSACMLLANRKIQFIRFAPGNLKVQDELEYSNE